MEITICLIPLALQCGIINDVISEIDKKPLKNIPHVSLFQMNINNSSLGSIINYLSALDIQYIIPNEKLSFKVNKIVNTYENISLDIEPLSLENYTQFKNTIIENLKSLRSSQLMKQINLNSLSTKQKELVSNYGIYWGVGPSLVKNHLTLSYNNTLTLNKNIPQEIEKLIFEFLAIAEIGEAGNIINILWKKPVHEYYSNTRKKHEY